MQTPGYQKGLELLESAQRMDTRVVEGLEEQLRALGLCLQSLEVSCRFFSAGLCLLFQHTWEKTLFLPTLVPGAAELGRTSSRQNIQRLLSSTCAFCLLVLHIRGKKLSLRIFPVCQLEIGSAALILCCYRDLPACSRQMHWGSLAGGSLLQHGQPGWEGQLATEPRGWSCRNCISGPLAGSWGFSPLFSGAHKLYPFASLPLLCQMG